MNERLQKFMAGCGVASRRKCEEIILEGRVKVNGTTVRELGTVIDSSVDKVMLDGKDLVPEESKVYIMLNKPKGYVTTVKDQFDRPTVLSIVKVKERIFPIGRLDYNTSGLLLLTNDGEIYNKIIHPRRVINKVYIAILKGTLNEDKIYQFKKGIDIGGYVTAPSDIKVINQSTNTTEAKITIHEGKNRQIRKMCEKIGNPVIELRRISIGEISLDELELGKWRYLSVKELDYLRNL